MGNEWNFWITGMHVGKVMESGLKDEEGYLDGYTETHRCTNPVLVNILGLGPIYHDSPTLIELEEGVVAVHWHCFFADRNAVPMKPGIIVRRTSVDSKLGTVITSSQDFYQVVRELSCDVEAGDFVLCSPFSGTRFEYQGEVLQFIPRGNIWLVVNESGVNAVEGFKLIPIPDRAFENSPETKTRNAPVWIGNKLVRQIALTIEIGLLDYALVRNVDLIAER